MNLFIFNSKKIVNRSLLLAVLLFCAYTIFLYIADPQVTLFQNQWLENYVIAQEYVYSRQQYRTVIVGSSMSARLLDEKFGHDIYNLSFAAGSVLTGLQIIIKNGKIPELILVETNFLERMPDQEMLEQLFTPVIWKIKRYLLPLQEKYQPINIVLSLLKTSFGRSHTERLDDTPHQKILTMMLSKHLETHDSAEIFVNNQEIVQVRELIEFLQNKGVNIAFFRMPVHPKIANSLRYQARANILNTEFRGMHIFWLPEPNDEAYETSDGLHLVYREALKFSIQLNAWIQDIHNNSLAL